MTASTTSASATSTTRAASTPSRSTCSAAANGPPSVSTHSYQRPAGRLTRCSCAGSGSVPSWPTRMSNSCPPIPAPTAKETKRKPDAQAPIPAKPSAEPSPLSPAMRQYRQFKEQYPGYVLFFRMGDFYEMFWEDAKVAAKTLGVALTSRSRGGIDAEDAIPMAGVPFHAVEGYLRRMIAAGHKVAICEQAEDPAQAKGLIKREVVRLMTPGTLTDEPLLDGRAENNLAAVAFNVTKSDGYRAAVAWVELSTGSCVAMSGSEGQVLDEIARLRPAEVLVPEHASGQPHEITARVKAAGVNAVTARPGW